jgi:archaellum component FlaC
MNSEMDLTKKEAAD